MGFEIEILQRKLPLYVPEKSIQTGGGRKRHVSTRAHKERGHVEKSACKTRRNVRQGD